MFFVLFPGTSAAVVPCVQVMACCCIPCLPKTDMGGADDPLPIIEIDEVMKDYVWNDYLTHLNPMKV